MLGKGTTTEVGAFGIDVIVVQPGGVRSSIADSGARELERYKRDSSRYRRAYAGIDQRAYASQHHPMEAEEFARGLITQVLATPAPRLVRLGAGVDGVIRLSELLDEQRDAKLSTNFRLDALAE